MSEKHITLRLTTDRSERSIKLVQGFQMLYQIKELDEAVIRGILDEYISPEFSSVIYGKIETPNEVLRHKKFIDPKYLNNLDELMSKLRSRTLNEQRIWQDSGYKEINSSELCPTSIRIYTRSRTGKSYKDSIELGWDSDDCYILKAAVFASAFEASMIRVDYLSTYKNYE
jgi:hypothetical protein